MKDTRKKLTNETAALERGEFVSTGDIESLSNKDEAQENEGVVNLDGASNANKD